MKTCFFKECVSTVRTLFDKLDLFNIPYTDDRKRGKEHGTIRL